MPSNRQKTNPVQEQGDDAVLAAAIAKRADLDAPSKTVSQASSAMQSPRQQEYEVTVAMPEAQVMPDDPVEDRTWSSVLGSVALSLITLVDFALHLSLAAAVAAEYGAARAETFFWLIAFGMAASLVGVVFLVSYVSGQQTPAGKALRERLERRESAAAMLLACVVNPELLRCLLPRTQHSLSIVKIDTLSTCLAGLPFCSLALVFAVGEGLTFCGAPSEASTISVHVLSTPLAPPAPLAPPHSLAPPAPPPPTFSSGDPTGKVVNLAVVAAGWTLMLVLLKLLRLTVECQTGSRTATLREQLRLISADLDAERAARADEYAELISLREYCYPEQYAHAQAGGDEESRQQAM